MKKLLPILVIVMLFVAGGTTYYAYSLYAGDNKTNEANIPKDEINIFKDNEIKSEEIEDEKVSTLSETDPIENETEKSLKTSLTIRLDDLIKISPETHDVYSNELSIPLTFINHTDREIKGFHASTYYKDMFGDLIFELEMKYEYDAIPANDSIQWLGAFDVNQFNEQHMRLYNIPYENVVFEYEILSIYFADGTVISK